MLGSYVACAVPPSSSHTSPNPINSSPHTLSLKSNSFPRQFPLLQRRAPPPMSSAAPSSKHAFQTILAGRKCYRMSKDKNEVVWPPHLEAALMEGERRSAGSVMVPMSASDNCPFRQASKSMRRPSPSLLVASPGFRTAISSSLSTSARKQARFGRPSRSGAASSSSATQARGSTVSSVHLPMPGPRRAPPGSLSKPLLIVRARSPSPSLPSLYSHESHFGPPL